LRDLNLDFARINGSYSLSMMLKKQRKKSFIWCFIQFFVLLYHEWTKNNHLSEK
jgi:hypothetical protein